MPTTPTCTAIIKQFIAIAIALAPLTAVAQLTLPYSGGTSYNGTNFYIDNPVTGSTSGIAIRATSNSGTEGTGINAFATYGHGITAGTTTNHGIYSYCGPPLTSDSLNQCKSIAAYTGNYLPNAIAIYASSNQGTAIRATSASGSAIISESGSGPSISSTSTSSYAVDAYSDSVAIRARSPSFSGAS